ncbi:MAG TPA: hypothetical protein VGH33_02425 [Isosphaeraceae bacterium]
MSAKRVRKSHASKTETTPAAVEEVTPAVVSTPVEEVTPAPEPANPEGWREVEPTPEAEPVTVPPAAPEPESTPEPPAAPPVPVPPVAAPAKPAKFVIAPERLAAIRAAAYAMVGVEPPAPKALKTEEELDAIRKAAGAKAAETRRANRMAAGWTPKDRTPRTEEELDAIHKAAGAKAAETLRLKREAAGWEPKAPARIERTPEESALIRRNAAYLAAANRRAKKLGLRLSPEQAADPEAARRAMLEHLAATMAANAQVVLDAETQAAGA